MIFVDLESICLGDPLYDFISMAERTPKFAAFNQGVLNGMSIQLTEEDWHAIGLYYIIRKIGEYLYHSDTIPPYLTSKQGWEDRYQLLVNPDAMRSAILFQ